MPATRPEARQDTGGGIRGVARISSRRVALQAFCESNGFAECFDLLDDQTLIPKHSLAIHHAKRVGAEIHEGKQRSIAFHAESPCLAGKRAAAATVREHMKRTGNVAAQPKTLRW